MNTTAQKQGWLLLVEQLVEQGWETASTSCASAGLAEWGRGELAGAGCFLGHEALQRISE